jgi:hypothetical protein
MPDKRIIKGRGNRKSEVFLHISGNLNTQPNELYAWGSTLCSRVPNDASRLLLQNLRSLNRQSCGFPSNDAAGNFTDGLESAALQQARGNGRPVAARTIDK